MCGFISRGGESVAVCVKPMASAIERHIDRIVNELEAAQTEALTLREDVAKHRRDAERLENKMSALQQECKNGRRAQSELKYTLDLNRRIRHLADIETKKASDAIETRDKESNRVRLLERRVENLEKELRERRSDGSTKLSSAIRKLANHPCAGKRLAAACHPDKVPAELCDIVTEFFRFVQSNRVIDIETNIKA